MRISVRNVRRSLQLPTRSAVRTAAAALGAVAGLLFAVPQSLAADGEAYVIADVQCDTHHDGVLDLTLINERAATEAVFMVTDAQSSATSQFVVTPQSAGAVTFTGLGDGPVTVAVEVDGVSADVAVSVACDPPLVASAPSGLSRSAGLALPATGASLTMLLVAAGLVVLGMAASLGSQRRHA